MNTKSKQQIVLLQGYYKYLYLWNFLNHVIKQNDLSKYALDLSLDTGDDTSFTLNGATIKKQLADIYKHADKKNFFWYITEISAFKGIFGVMRELLENNEEFYEFIKKKLGKQFFPFDQITRFCRNVLVHAMDANISLVRENFYAQKSYLKEQEKHKIVFTFKYANYLKVRKWSKDYGVYIKVDFNKLRAGKAFFSVVSLHELYMLAELCYNLGEIFKHQNK